MNLRRSTNALLLMLGNGAAIALKLFLTSQRVPASVGIPISVAIGACFYGILYYLVFQQMMRSPRVRNLFDSVAALEGRWVQELKGIGNRGFSHLEIWFDYKAAKYRIQGVNLSSQPDPEALFAGTIVKSSVEEAKITYYFDAVVSTGVEHLPVQGVGQISFMMQRGGGYNAGFGWLVDNSGVKDTETRIITFKLAKAPKVSRADLAASSDVQSSQGALQGTTIGNDRNLISADVDGDVSEDTIS